MTLDVIIYSIVTTLAIIAACYGITRLKGIWIIGALLYGWGCILSSAVAYLIFYPLFSGTNHVFIPAVVGFCVWSVLFFRLVLQHIYWSRRNQTISHP